MSLQVMRKPPAGIAAQGPLLYERPGMHFRQGQYSHIRKQSPLCLAQADVLRLEFRPGLNEIIHWRHISKIQKCGFG
jgi:hypothetical protein